MLFSKLFANSFANISERLMQLIQYASTIYCMPLTHIHHAAYT
jgi:hypothetical protein